MKAAKAVASAGMLAVSVLAACTDPGGAGSSDEPAEILCQNLPAAEVVKLFDL